MTGRKLLAAMWLLYMTGCGQQEQIAHTAHTALTVITDTGQPAYRMVVAYCETQQWGIVHDPERTVSQKKAAVAKVRTKCHAIYEVFEKAAKLQPEVRTLIDSIETAADAAAALAKVDEIRLMIMSAHEQFDKLRRADK